jgi:clan AA aspartic protease (TIGR02281 family)
MEKKRSIMKKSAFLLIFFFALLPIAHSGPTFDQEMERIYRKNAGKGQEDEGTKVIKVAPDGSGHLLVNAVLNGKVNASLTLDTGSPLLCLTANIARKLGFDLGNLKNVGEVMLLNGKHKVAYVNLKSVNLGGAEQENVPAAVLLDDDKGVANTFNDGLLGLSFLSKFNFTLDGDKGELILKKIP